MRKIIIYRKKLKSCWVNERGTRRKSKDRVTEFAALRPKPFSCLTDDSDKNEKIKGIKKCVIKQKLKFEDYKNCLEATQIENNISQLKR